MKNIKTLMAIAFLTLFLNTAINAMDLLEYKKAIEKKHALQLKKDLDKFIATGDGSHANFYQQDLRGPIAIVRSKKLPINLSQ